MTSTHALAVHAAAFWSDRVPDWALLRAVCRGQAQPLDEPQRLPSSTLLSAAERRRAPESVQIALHVAQQAVQLAGVDPSTLVTVFASPHGDLGITDAMCETLAHDAADTSPTRFIHSVHNAVAGHWGIAQRCVRPSTSIAAGRHTFACGLLEAATQAACSGEPVLLVAYETQPHGATARLTGTEGRMAVAVVLAPTSPDAGPFVAKGESSASHPTLRWRVAEAVRPQEATASSLPRTLDKLARNHLADALVWLNALANADKNEPPVLALPLSGALDGGVSLHIEWHKDRQG
jgi:hypothetical protein